MKVSVVIAVYNSEPHIHSCLENLKAQTLNDFETILVVDSRSEDASVDVCLSLSEKYPNTSVIVQYDDDRVGGARNLGMDVAKGDYIWFLDVDDCFSHNFLKMMTSIAHQYNVEMVVCNFYYSKSKKTIAPPKRQFNTSIQDNGLAMIELNNGRYSTNLFNKIIKTSFLKSNEIRMTPRYCEDYEFLKDCFMNQCKVAYCN